MQKAALNLRVLARMRKRASSFAQPVMTEIAANYTCGMRQFCKYGLRMALPAIVLALLAQTSNAQAPANRFRQVVQPYVDAQMFMGSVLVKTGKPFSARAMAWRTWSGAFPILPPLDSTSPP